MCKMQCMLLFLSLFLSAVRSWDLAITSGGKLDLYATNKTQVGSVATQFKDLTALAYDAVHNMLLFVDKQTDNASIFSYHFAPKKYQALVAKKSSTDIQGLDFDPVTNTLFWVDTSEKSIYWMSLQSGTNMIRNLLISFNEEIPRAIAVDSCNGYIYWTNAKVGSATIERARFDGTERKVIVSTDLFRPISLVIDQRSRRMYWADDKLGVHYTVETTDLEGRNREVVVRGINNKPNAMTLSKDHIYWIYTSAHSPSVWKVPKAGRNLEEPSLFLELSGHPYGIVANYTIEDQTEGVDGCMFLKKLANNKTSINETYIKCKPGYSGEKCDISVCLNYCFQGTCSISVDGKPSCSCTEGFKGHRCEVNVCTGYCLNNGVCSLDKDQTPVCQCSGDHEGDRCEMPKLKPATVQLKTNAPELQAYESCNCTSQLSGTEMSPDLVMACDDSWDSVRDPIILVLGVLCGLLFLTCCWLVTKILKLKRRPRIKKRIIVNKNVTPMTARPDQCEITIENCCNMNICETPCFEPRSTIRPSLLDTKPGKEEKKNLIANMEYPDDY